MNRRTVLKMGGRIAAFRLDRPGRSLSEGKAAVSKTAAGNISRAESGMVTSGDTRMALQVDQPIHGLLTELKALGLLKDTLIVSDGGFRSEAYFDVDGRRRREGRQGVRRDR